MESSALRRRSGGPSFETAAARPPQDEVFPIFTTSS
jgi:hypothetical protein